MRGVFKGKITDYGVSTTQAGKPQVFIVGQFDDPDGLKKSLTWYGGFSEKGTQYTLRTLLYCGLAPKNASKLNQLINGPESGLLDMDLLLDFDVQTEEYRDRDGNKKTRTSIKYINNRDLSPGVQRIDEAKNNSFFGENENQFSADITRIANSIGLPVDGLQRAEKKAETKPDKEPEIPSQTDADFTMDDIPF